MSVLRTHTKRCATPTEHANARAPRPSQTQPQRQLGRRGIALALLQDPAPAELCALAVQGARPLAGGDGAPGVQDDTPGDGLARLGEAQVERDAELAQLDGAGDEAAVLCARALRRTAGCRVAQQLVEALQLAPPRFLLRLSFLILLPAPNSVDVSPPLPPILSPSIVPY